MPYRYPPEFRRKVLDLYVAQTPTVEGADITRETAVTAAANSPPPSR